MTFTTVGTGDGIGTDTITLGVQTGGLGVFNDQGTGNPEISKLFEQMVTLGTNGFQLLTVTISSFNVGDTVTIDDLNDLDSVSFAKTVSGPNSRTFDISSFDTQTVRITADAGEILLGSATVVPSPMAAGGGLAMLGMTMLRRRKA